MPPNNRHGHTLRFNARLAKDIGLNEAIVVQQLAWIQGKDRMVYRGRPCVERSIGEVREMFPFLSENTLRRAVSRLEEKKLVARIHDGNFHHSNLYFINETALALLLEPCQNGTPQATEGFGRDACLSPAKMAPLPCQNGTPQATEPNVLGLCSKAAAVVKVPPEDRQNGTPAAAFEEEADGRLWLDVVAKACPRCSPTSRRTESAIAELRAMNVSPEDALRHAEVYTVEHTGWPNPNPQPWQLVEHIRNRREAEQVAVVSYVADLAEAQRVAALMPLDTLGGSL